MPHLTSQEQMRHRDYSITVIELTVTAQLAHIDTLIAITQNIFNLSMELVQVEVVWCECDRTAAKTVSKALGSIPVT
jgi:hypothetical protein